MKKHWAKWVPKPSPMGMWMIAVFSAERPSGAVEVALRLDDGTVVNATVDASTPARIRNGVWACPTAEHMTVKTVPACPSCGQPMRLPMASGGTRHQCSQTASGKPAKPATDDAETLF